MGYGFEFQDTRYDKDQIL